MAGGMALASFVVRTFFESLLLGDLGDVGVGG